MNLTHTWTVHLQAHYGLTIAAIHPIPISNRLSLRDVLVEQSKELTQQPSAAELDSLNQCRFLDVGHTGHVEHAKRIWQLQNLNRSLSCLCNNTLLAYGDTIVLTESDEFFDLELGLFHFIISYQAWADLSSNQTSVSVDANTLSESNRSNLDLEANLPISTQTPSVPAFSLTDLAPNNRYDGLNQGLIFDIKDGAFNDAAPAPTAPAHTTQTQVPQAIAPPSNPTPQPSTQHPSPLPTGQPNQALGAVDELLDNDSELEQILAQTEQPKELVQLHADYIAVIKDPTLLLNAHAWKSHSVNRLGTSDEFSSLMERAKIYPHIHEVIQPDKNLMAVVDSLDSLTDSSILDPEKKVDILMLFAPEDLKNITPPLINRLTGFTAQEHHITSLDSVF
jgi:hypothetical protein